LDQFWGYHSEWNLGSPGGWDYQRVNQEIAQAVWAELNRVKPIPVALDFSHPLFFPVVGFAEMLVAEHRRRSGPEAELIAVVAEEETLADVTENINLARRLDAAPGVASALMAPHELELRDGRVSYRGVPVSVAFVDFNSDVLLALHRKHGLAPLLQAVREGRVINPRGMEPINVKSMFEVITGPERGRFDPEIAARTPWTRQFHPRATTGPQGEPIADLVAWTRDNWEDLVLKPERGYSGRGVMVGGLGTDADPAIGRALGAGDYIVQDKVPLSLWAEDIPELDEAGGRVVLTRVQTDFRSLVGPAGMFGFLGRYGGVPTNVGSGGGVQPLALLTGAMPVREAAARINDAIMGMDYGAVAEAVALQRRLARERRFTYLLGPIKIALRPRLITAGQIAALTRYGGALWRDCRLLERMWRAGELDGMVRIEAEELAIARSQPWEGGAAIIAADGLLSFGAHPEGP
jgi:hypothetical protein